MYWDNGVELSVIENNHFTLISYLVTTNNGVTKLSSSISNLGYDMNSLQMGGIKVFGVATKPSKILVNGVLFSNFTYDTKNQVLQITQLQLSMSKECTISWS